MINIDKEKISKCKKGVLIVNNAGGAIMDTQAVADACSNGHVAGNSKPAYKKIVYSSKRWKLVLKFHPFDKSLNCIGYSGDVWFPQPAPKDHPWRDMANHAMTLVSGTTIDAQVF